MASNCFGELPGVDLEHPGKSSAGVVASGRWGRDLGEEAFLRARELAQDGGEPD